MAERIGGGTMVSGGGEPTVGTFVALLDVEDLMKAMDAGGSDLVAYLEHPNVTMMAPIQSRLAAIVCANGDEQAHVAIVSRELGLPCAVQLTLDDDPTSFDGARVRLDPDGTLHREG
jgi:signal transduction protein with GAF and PtsI domain